MVALVEAFMKSGWGIGEALFPPMVHISYWSFLYMNVTWLCCYAKFFLSFVAILVLVDLQWVVYDARSIQF